MQRMIGWTSLFAVGMLGLVAQEWMTTSGQAAPKSKNDPADQSQISLEWPMWGGSLARNMVSPTKGISLSFQPIDVPKQDIKKRRVRYTADLGSRTYGNPVVASGTVLVGTNNGGNHRPQIKGDKGCVLAFDARTGHLLWQLTRDKLVQGRVNDWPEQGICSTPFIEKKRMWVVTNRAELMCVDMDGFYDQENDGIQSETYRELQDADIVWSFDMIAELGVFPHNLATSSPLVYGDLVYILTSNGVDDAHKRVVSPRSPSLIAVHKQTGKLVWEENSPARRILHGQWSSPAIGLVNGKPQLIYAGGDGWLYSLEPRTGKLIWKCDLNPKDSRWVLDGRGTRNNVIATPVFVDNSVVVGVGQDPDHGSGVGHLYRIDAAKKGDISSHLALDKEGKPLTWERETFVDARKGHQMVNNPNAGVIWHYGGIDVDGSVTGTQGDIIFHRTISTVAVHNGLVFAVDLTGFFHCLDFKTGKRVWSHDLLEEIWGSPMVVDGKVFIGDSAGGMTIFAASRKKQIVKTVEFGSSIYSTPTIAHGMMFVSDRSRLYAIELLRPKSEP